MEVEVTSLLFTAEKEYLVALITPLPIIVNGYYPERERLDFGF